MAKDGKREEFWKEGDPGYYRVPQSALNPIGSLPIDKEKTN